MITTVCKISYGSQTVPPIVPAVQGDTGRAISFEIADFTPPAGATATYFILKPSGEAIYNSATITDNSILCELTAQSLAEAGENRMQVRVLQGEDIVTSFEVILMVRTFLGDDAMESGTEMNIFDQAVEQATEQFQTNAEQVVEEVIESIPADYTELTEEVDELNERLSDEIADVNINLQKAIDEFAVPTQEAVDNWLEAHPEATTTVENHSLTYEKFVNGTLRYITPEMFGAKGDGLTDDTSAINSALSFNDCKVVLFTKQYLITDTLNFYSNAELIGVKGSKVISKAEVLRPIFKGNNISNVKIDGLTIEGNAQYDTLTDSRTYIETGLHFNGICSDIKISNCKITKCGQAGIYLQSAINVLIDNCYISYLERIPSLFTGGQNYCFGIRTYTSIDSLKISNTEIYDVAIGVYLTHGGTNIEIYNCHVHDISAQHAFYCATSNFSIHDCLINTIYTNGISVQFDSSSTASANTIIRSNIIKKTGNAIALNNIVNSSIVFTDLLIENNIFEESTYALYFCCTERLTFKNNVIRLMERNGIFVVANKITKEAFIIGNYFYNVAQNEVSGYNYGMQLQYIENCLVQDNVILSKDNKMRYGIYATNTASNLTILGNIVNGASDFSFRIDDSNTSVKYFSDNLYDMPINSQIMNVEGLPTKIFARSTAPSSGYHSRGEITYNTTVDIGEPLGWVCITSGSPGTWKPFSIISA